MHFLSGVKTTVVAKEFEPTEIPLDLLLIEGKIEIFPGVEKYFEIDYRSGRLVVSPKSYVGLIPINRNLALRVVPRFSIENLFYILRRSSARLSFIEGAVRAYGLLEMTEGDPLEILAKRFVQQLELILPGGLALRYHPEDEAQSFKGSIDISASVSLFWARGQRTSQAWFEDDLTADSLENRLIKSALSRVAGYYRSKATSEAKNHLIRLSRAEHLFASISDIPNQADIDEREVRRAIDTLPSHRPEYIPLVWISYLLHSRRGLAVESSSGIEFDTFVVNLAEVFEDYVRAVVESGLHKPIDKIHVKNGNVDRVRLLGGAQQYHVQPDIYLTSPDGCLLVADAKYKQSVKAPDRYEVLAFCEALQCKSAVLISPYTAGVKIESLGQTPGGVKFWRAQIDLSADDMIAEESKLIQNLKMLVPAIPKVAPSI